MNDETNFVPDNGTTVAPDVSSQTNAAVVTPPTATPTLSLTDVERLLSERENKLRAEFDSQRVKWQSKSDKAYAKAMAEVKVIEDNAALLGLEPDAVQSAKQGVINKNFDATFSAPDPTPEPVQPQYQTYSPYAGEQETAAYLKQTYGLDMGELDLSDILGQPKSQELAAKLDERAKVKEAQKIIARQEERANKAAAQPVAQLKNEYGKLGSPVNGTPSAGYDPVTELEKLSAQEPPNDPVAFNKYNERMKELYAQAYQRG